MAEKAGGPEDKGFKVVDRRRVGVEEKPAEAVAAEATASTQPSGEPSGEPSGKSGAEPAGSSLHEQVLGPIDFQTFLVSLASSALIHLGEAPNPETGQTEASFPHAKQTIDLLSLLQQKTSGNLTPDESRLLLDLLRDLRLRFVHVTSLK